jgi:glycosyltransferase involved in cell wall biosynthesis
LNALNPRMPTNSRRESEDRSTTPDEATNRLTSGFSSEKPSVVVVCAVYPPEPVVSAQMAQDLAVHLAEAHAARVTVLCPFPSRPIGVVHGGFEDRSTPLVAQEGPVTVVRLPSHSDARSRFVGRLRESFSFGWHVEKHLSASSSRPDVVYANTWPVASQALIARYCRRYRVPLVWHIKDLYPEAWLTRLPASLRSLFRLPLITLDQWLVRQAAHTVVLSESVRDAYLESRGANPESVTTILDWTDESKFGGRIGRQAACSRYGLSPEPFTFLYLGNIGVAAGVEMLIEAFHGTTPAPLRLVIVGDGASKARCQALVATLGETRVHFVSDADVANTHALLEIGDVCLLPLKRGAGGSSIPSKLMAYLLSSKPVLANLDADCDTARCIRAADCGWTGPPEDANWLTGQMMRVAKLPAADLQVLGSRGRSFGLKMFSKGMGVCRLADIILRASGHPADVPRQGHGQSPERLATTR